MPHVDLHLHTTASDGQQSPAEVVLLAHEIGLDCIAITDHDTTDGVGPALEAAAGSALEIIPGIELSAEDENGDVHILGYGVDLNNADFQAQLRAFRQNRYDRGLLIVEKLASLGVQIAWEDVLGFADGGAVGRPHIARALVAAGHAADVKDAFDRYIANDKPGYVARKRLSPEDSIAMIHTAGGVAVLAHPILVHDYPAMTERLSRAGLDGIEKVYPRHDAHTEATIQALADRFGLIVTGGSDFHGLGLPVKAMLGSVNPPKGCVEALRQRIAARRSGG